ncbi:hypothetical protein TVNIR_1298 [Thioalkalivibrio nitratireducens DSM 14787]|uniref:DUF2868 domain-containing protein n=1 Tax=Thioalkalivibrio nitratireducens (strain DSM 14787 / UNIQEM 213 / ALEN2) TaxID=1255043 RepID=L0DX96_THIND|nr:DUF2868 domain-containing protein [Thioalkalivibrio nitratireducens]AGA32971.1 hypothetical protein TVNIR_1298 [Thioalkalivibrio nitratireducens DSM 14787]
MTAPQTPFRQRLLAEAVRMEEDRLGRLIEDPAAEARAREGGGDFEQRILRRAVAMDLGRRLATSLENIRQVRSWLLVLVSVLAFLAGVGAAVGVFSQESQINILWALSALLGLQLLMLLLWLVLILYRPRGGGGLLGRAAMGIVHRLGRRLCRQPEAGVVLAAGVGLLRRDGLGKWIASSLTHGLWFLFSLGALLGSMFALSVRQYDFVWGTTLLTEGSFVALVAMLGAPAQGLGWPVPDPAVVMASRIGEASPAGRELWSALLLSALVFYGLVPRLLLTGLSVVLARRALRRLRLDTSLPGYARLSDRLGAPARSIGVLDPQPPDPGTVVPAARGRPGPVRGPVRLIGLELQRTDEDWPPRLAGVDWIPVGRADDRAQRRDVLAALRSWPDTEGVVLVLCSLARTPDRGAERFLAAVCEQSPVPVWAVLDEARLLRSRGIDPAARARQWQAAAGRAGLDYVLEAELDDPRHPGTRELANLLGQGVAPA